MHVGASAYGVECECACVDGTVRACRVVVRVCMGVVRIGVVRVYRCAFVYGACGPHVGRVPCV